ncbi:hypothetical protein HMPREF9946_02234 [Acetobacteraceae bacterium AT-5844]|nr:hypothetical protein HMPREF9946_02234 [Acetobacteraceae bacterium AT-5844]
MSRFVRRIQAVDVKADIAANVPAALAAFARQDRDATIAAGRASENYRTFVDGREGAVEETVRPDGSILYRFSFMGEIAAYALAELQSRAPSDTGHYRKQFWLMIDGRFISPASFDPERVGTANQVVIYNREPYSRKLDVQIAGGRKLRVRVEPFWFDDAARAVNRRFGNVVRAWRRYTIKHPTAQTTQGGRPIEYPALVIDPITS